MKADDILWAMIDERIDEKIKKLRLEVGSSSNDPEDDSLSIWLLYGDDEISEISH